MIPPLDPRADAWPHGPRSLVLIGPPGTGKTTALLGTWLAPALEAGVPPHRILACSFTKAAAGELAHRLAHKVGVDPEDLERTCCTIHSEAYGRVRMIDPGLRVRGEDREQLQPDDADAAETSGLRAAAKLVWDYVRSTLAGQGLPIRERVEEVCGSHFATDRRIVQYTPAQLASEIEDYEQAKRERHELDFTDMLELALRVEPRELELLVVDEAQDLSPLQWTLVSRWFERARTVVLCGDPDQAIHTWCGADPAPLPWYARHADWTARRLAKSHRVPRAAHRLARGLILQDPERMDAPYDPADRDGTVEEVARVDAVSALERAAEAGRPRPGEPRALVLARSKSVLAGAARELAAVGVPYLSERGYSPLGAPSALAIARALLGLRAGGAYVRDVRQLLHELPAKLHFPSRRKAQVLTEINEWPEDARVTVETLEVLGIGVRSFLVGSLVDGLRAAKVGQDRRSLSLGRDRAAELEVLVERWGAQVLDADAPIVLTTLHASKGREAELVVLDLAMPYPTIQAIERGDDAEERRLLYVGLTRTKQDLLLLRGSRERDLGHALGLGGVRALETGPLPGMSVA